MPVLIPSANPLIHKPCINKSIRLHHIPAIHDNRMSLSGQLLQLPGIQRIIRPVACKDHAMSTHITKGNSCSKS